MTTTAIVEGTSPHTIAAPGGSVADRSSVAFSIAERRLEIGQVASMLPADDTMARDLRQVLDLSLADDLTDTTRNAYLSTVDEPPRGRHGSIVPMDRRQFTITSRRTTIPITVRTKWAQPLRVKVRLTSPKLNFPKGDQIITVTQYSPPFRVPVEAKTNGTFQVTATLLTPDGDAPLGPPMAITVRSTALSGLGILVTIAAALGLAAWWIQHLRSKRRRRAAAASAERHPTAPIDRDQLSVGPASCPSASSPTRPATCRRPWPTTWASSSSPSPCASAQRSSARPARPDPVRVLGPRAASAEPPETAAPSPGPFEVAYRTLSDAGADGIVVVAVSALLSGTAQSAQLAASAVSGAVAVEVVDSRSITSGLGMVAVAAARRARAGGTIDDVAPRQPRSRAAPRCTWLDPSDGHAVAGRRGAGLAAARRCRSIIEVRDGQVEEAGRARGRAAASPTARQGPRPDRSNPSACCTPTPATSTASSPSSRRWRQGRSWSPTSARSSAAIAGRARSASPTRAGAG